MKNMFDYTICNEADRSLFFRQCSAIKKHIDVLEEEKLLEDVDGKLKQKYRCSNGTIVVTNDAQVDALYVE